MLQFGRFAILIGLCLSASSALAEYVPLSIRGTRDFVFDREGVLYVSTASGDILRYDTQAASFLAPFKIGSPLLGIDLSPDGKTLAVADSTRQGSKVRIHLVDSTTGVSQPVSFDSYISDSGTYMVAWGSNGQVFVSGDYQGSGVVKLRRYDPQTNTTTDLGIITERTMLTASADRNTIAIAEANTSGGPITAFGVESDVAQAHADVRQYLFEIAVDRDGDRFLVPTARGAYVYDNIDGDLERQSLIETPSGRILAAVFSPVNDVFFTTEMTWAGSAHGVHVYDANTLALIGTIDSYPFEWHFFEPLGAGRMEISPDGRQLVVAVESGVRVYDVSRYVPEPQSVWLFAAGGIALLWGARSRCRQ